MGKDKEEYYLVRIEETLARTFKVSKNKANTLEEAEALATDVYQNVGIILDADDFSEVEITAREVSGEDLSLFEEIEEE